MAKPMETIEKLKKGDYFKLITANGPSKTVYVYDGYNRYTRKYSYFKFDDVNDFKEKKKGAPITKDFDF